MVAADEVRSIETRRTVSLDVELTMPEEDCEITRSLGTILYHIRRNTEKKVDYQV